KLDDMTIASHLSMLIIGGAETFPKVFANLVRRLGEHPGARAECVADPSLIPEAFLEGLRFDMPTQFLCRTVTKEHQIHGQTLRPGQPILYLYPSANRDPREFDDPDTFDIHRNAPRILSFGHGTHSCIGLHVAKMEGKICLEEMLARMPEFEVPMDRADRLITDFVQGFAHLPVTFAPF
ncbi:MAG TPA: cytochrome P450, partial [Myxococcota bacterium]|nr:cytochrome P450 [Myxococcota bacterium]